MSHFTLLVIHEAHDDLDTLLDKYDENKEVEPRFDEAITPEDFARAVAYFAELDDAESRTLAAKAGDGDVPASLEILREYNGGVIKRSADGGYERWTTYNPHSKWDWWVVGGRWRGALRLKPGGKSLHAPQRHWGETMHGENPEPIDPLATDSARKGDLDIAGMRDAAGAAATRDYDEVHAVIDGHPAIRPWPEFLADVKAERVSIDQARAAYGEQPGIVALKALDKGFFFSVEPFLTTRQEYVASARAAAIPGFATLVDGEWIEPGQMGWWGMSTDTPASQREYQERVNKIIDAADDDLIFTILDLHI